MLLRNMLMFVIYMLALGLTLTIPSFSTSFGLSGLHFGFTLILMTIILGPIDIKKSYIVAGNPFPALNGITLEFKK